MRFKIVRYYFHYGDVSLVKSYTFRYCSEKAADKDLDKFTHAGLTLRNVTKLPLLELGRCSE